MISFAFLAVYMLFLYIRPMEWETLPLYGLDRYTMGFGVMDFLTIAVGLCWVFKRASQGGRWVRSATDWMVLGLFGAALFSHIPHTYFGGLTYTAQEFGKIVLLYYFVVNILDTRGKVKAFAAVLVGLTAFMALHGALQIHRGYGFSGQYPLVVNETQVRITAFGIFNDPNDLGLTFVVAMPFLMMGLTGRHGFFTRVISLGLMGLTGYGLFLTNSRGSLVALVVMAFVYFYKRFGKTLGVILGTLLVVGLMYYGPSRVGEIGSDPSGAGRRDIWSEGLQMFRANPLWGVGQRMFEEHAYGFKSAHNSFVNAFAELGLIGLFFYIGILYLTLRDLHRITRAEIPEDSEPEDLENLINDRHMARALYASLWGFLAASFFLSRTYNQVPYVLVGLATALANIRRFEAADKILAPEDQSEELPEEAEILTERTWYDFFPVDTRRVLMLTLATVPAVYVLCRILWRL